LFEEQQHLVGRDVPDDIQLDLIVAVNDSVPRADDLAPRDCRVILPKLDREAAGRFADERNRV
jgi:hypothetical protein